MTPPIKGYNDTLSNKIMEIVNADIPNGDKQGMAEAIERQYRPLADNKACQTCKLIEDRNDDLICWDKPNKDIEAQTCIDHVINDSNDLIPINFCPECGQSLTVKE